MEQMRSDEDRLSRGQIKAKAIVEVVGKPKEYVESSLDQFLKRLREDEGYEIITADNHPAEKREEHDNFFSAFTELTFWAKSMNGLIDFCFNAMPSSIEIILPTGVAMNANELSGYMNDISGRLHEADMIVKAVRSEKKLLDENALAVFRNFITFQLRGGPKTAEELAAPMGVTAEQLTPFLNVLVKDSKIKESSGKFSL